MLQTKEEQQQGFPRISIHLQHKVPAPLRPKKFPEGKVPHSTYTTKVQPFSMFLICPEQATPRM
jgi:hypothetical protein